MLARAGAMADPFELYTEKIANAEKSIKTLISGHSVIFSDGELKNALKTEHEDIWTKLISGQKRSLSNYFEESDYASP